MLSSLAMVFSVKGVGRDLSIARVFSGNVMILRLLSSVAPRNMRFITQVNLRGQAGNTT